MSLEIDLIDLFGEEVPEDVAISFGQAVIDKILERTGAGKKLGGGSFRGYSDSYAKSLEFKAAGKSQGSPNLELTGGMLSSIDIVEATPARLVISFNDKDEIPKAYNHQVGDTLPARPFFGLSPGELESLRREYAPEVSRGVEREVEIFSALAAPEAVKETARRLTLLDILGDIDDF